MASKKPSKPQFQAPQYTELSLPELRTALESFVGQEGMFDKLQGTLSSSASKRMDALETLRPGYKAGLDKAQQVADSYAQGNVPADVAQKISQSAAFKGLMTGSGAQQRSQIEARDLGLTSMDLQGRGLAAQQAIRAETQAMMPLQALNLAFTPQYIRQEDVSTATYNNQIKNRQADANANTYNQQQMANYQYDQQYGGSPWGAIGGGILGAGLGVLAAPFTGGMSIPMGLGIGSQMGGFFGGSVGQGVGSGMAGLGFGAASLMGQMNAGAGPGFPNFYNNSAPTFRTNTASVGLRSPGGGANFGGQSYSLFPQFDTP